VSPLNRNHTVGLTDMCSSRVQQVFMRATGHSPRCFASRVGYSDDSFDLCQARAVLLPLMLRYRRWLLAAGVIVLVLGLLVSGAGSITRNVLGIVGVVLIGIWVPLALRARRERQRSN
jgi:hypothetical protein